MIVLSALKTRMNGVDGLNKNNLQQATTAVGCCRFRLVTAAEE